MTLVPGTQLGPYRIVAAIGAGGMGEVYRALDKKLGREVAIKLLPDSVSNDPERLIRLEREARALASLHHPNIASIFGLEQTEGRHFLVMELVPGEDLSSRILRAPLSPEDVIVMARQLAEGLEDAHQKGIVHRDLKPANIKVTPDDRVKILDFGLAQAYAGDTVVESDPGASPTISAGLTAAGTILGTPAYMSPEQARGKPVDRRTDIWSFGCVLYECLSGRPAFTGETASDLMVAILQAEPDWDLLPAATPARLRELLVRCLRKDARNRLRDIGDARVLLEELSGRIPSPSGAVDARSSEPRARRLRRLWPWAVVGAFALGALASTALWRRIDAGHPRALRAPSLRVAIAVPDLEASAFNGPSLTSDGRSIAYISRGRLWIHSLERFEVRAVPGSDGVGAMFWSPDGETIGFSRERRLWTWRLASTESLELCALPGSGQVNGAIWMPDGKVYFCLYAGGIYVVSASGGEPELLLDLAAGEFDFHQPAPLPGGTEFVAVAHRDGGQQQAFVFSCAEGKRHPVLERDELSTVAFSPAGYLLLARNWTTQDLWAVRFSPATRKVAGEPFLVERGAQGPSVAANGAMVYYQGDRESLFDLLWVSQDGWEIVPGGPFQGLREPAVSPDGRRIAYSGVMDDNRDIWVLDLERGTRTRLTSDRSNEFSPRWSADGRTVFYRTWIPGKDNLWRVSADGGSAPEFVAEGSLAAPLPDGRSVVISAEGKHRHDSNLYLTAMEPGAEPTSLLETEFDEDQPAVSPDGRWLAYRSNESGAQEVFLRRLAGGSRRQASVGGGGNPMWGTRGDAVYYWQGDILMEVLVGGGADPEPGRPQPVLSASELGVRAGARGYTSGRSLSDYALFGFGGSPDGRRFLIGRRSPDDPRAGILYVQNWEPQAP